MNSITISRDKNLLKIGILLSIIKMLYINVISLLLSDDWQGFDYNKCINFSYIIYEIIPFYIGLAIYLRGYRNNGITFFSTIFFIMAFIPANSGLSVSNVDVTFYLFNHIYLIIFLFLLKSYSIKVGDFKGNGYGFIENYLSNKRATLWFRLMLILLIILSIYRVYMYNGLNFQNVVLEAMYDVRGENADFYSSKEGSIYSYLFIITSGIMFWLIPIFLYSAFIRKNSFDIGLSLFAVFAEFMSSMMKSTLFVFAIIFFVYYLYRRKKLEKGIKLFILGIGFLLTIPIFEYIIYGDSLIFSLVINRIFYMTQYMISCHYDFFSNHSKFWFSQECFFIQNIVSNLIGSPYNSGAIKLISDNCFSGLIPAPNAGLFAEAFAQMGYLGAFVFPFIHMYLVKIVYKSAAFYGYGVVLLLMTKFFLRLESVYNLESGYIITLLLFVAFTYVLKSIKYTYIQIKT